MEYNPDFTDGPQPIPTQTIISRYEDTIAMLTRERDAARRAALEMEARRDTLRDQLEQVVRERDAALAAASDNEELTWALARIAGRREDRAGLWKRAATLNRWHRQHCGGMAFEFLRGWLTKWLDGNRVISAYELRRALGLPDDRE